MTQATPERCLASQYARASSIDLVSSIIRETFIAGAPQPSEFLGRLLNGDKLALLTSRCGPVCF